MVINFDRNYLLNQSSFGGYKKLFAISCWLNDNDSRSPKKGDLIELCENQKTSLFFKNINEGSHMISYSRDERMREFNLGTQGVVIDEKCRIIEYNGQKFIAGTISVLIDGKLYEDVNPNCWKPV